MRPNLADLELVRGANHGDEAVYVCPECQKPKMYVNTSTLAYFCFVCQRGGCAIGDPTSSSPKKEWSPSPLVGWWKGQLEVPITVQDAQKLFRGVSGIHHDVRAVSPLAIAPMSPAKSDEIVYRMMDVLEMRVMADGTVILPLRDKEEKVNFVHSYNSSRTPRYVTDPTAYYEEEGGVEKGLSYITIYRTNNFTGRPAVILVYEGLWDYINSIITLMTLHATNRWVPQYPVRLAFLGGNRPTHDQLLAIGTGLAVFGRVLWMFDSDLASPAMNASMELHNLTGASSVLVHVPFGVKDWDEVLQEHGHGPIALTYTVDNALRSLDGEMDQIP